MVRRWKTDPEVVARAGRSALLTIDMQRDFARPGSPSEIAGTLEVVPNIVRLLDSFRTAGRPVVHVVRLYLADGSNADACRRRLLRSGRSIAVPGTEGAEVVADLWPPDAPPLDSQVLLQGQLQKVADSEWVMYKPRWGAFYDTPLETHLRELGVDTLMVCGCNFPNCPRTTVYEASERDVRVVFVADATSGTYEQGCSELDAIGVSVQDTDPCLAWLSQPSPAVATPPG